MREHQRRILSRMVDEIDQYRDGNRSPAQTLDNIWGLYTAAEIERTPEGEELQELYIVATTMDDARQDFMPDGLGKDADFEDCMDALRVWAADIRESGELP
jgi:hypothetical protein